MQPTRKPHLATIDVTPAILREWRFPEGMRAPRRAHGSGLSHRKGMQARRRKTIAQSGRPPRRTALPRPAPLIASQKEKSSAQGRTEPEPSHDVHLRTLKLTRRVSGHKARAGSRAVHATSVACIPPRPRESLIATESPSAASTASTSLSTRLSASPATLGAALSPSLSPSGLCSLVAAPS